jgi:hypothetical protein
MVNDTARNIRPSRGASAKRFIPPSELAEPSRSRIQKSLEHAKVAIEEDLTGIIAGGARLDGLFPVVKTGVSTEPVMDAANAFRATLSREQWGEVNFGIDDSAWRSWHNIHVFLMRHGLMLHGLAPAQRDAAMRLIEASSSSAGYQSARDIMKLNHHAGEITGSTDEFDEWYYWISIFGEPSTTEPWGWQIDGHHLIINCFVYGDQMVMTPDFRGSEPVFAEFGKHAGTRVFQEEEANGQAFMAALAPEQQQQAVMGTELPREVATGAQLDNLDLDYAGMRCDGLAPQQREHLLALLETYAGRVRPGQAEIRMEDVKKHLSDTWFGWIGDVTNIGDPKDRNPFYYRLHSPVILIEFDHMPGIVWDNANPTRDHIHAIVRTPNGNDYGHDLLRQHYAMHDHSDPHTHHRRGLS